MHWRNNIFLGENLNAGAVQRDDQHQLHLVGLQRLPAEPGARRSFRWNSPPFGVLSDSAGAGATPVRDDAQLRDAGGVQRGDGAGQHSVLLDYDVFVNVPRLDANDLAQRTAPYRAAGLDFSLRPGSAAVDRGSASRRSPTASPARRPISARSNWASRRRSTARATPRTGSDTSTC